MGIFFVKLLYSGLETLCRMCKTWNGRLCKWLLTIGAFKWATSLQWALKLNALKSSRIIAPFSSKFIEPEYVKRVENNTKKTQKIFDKTNVKIWLAQEWRSAAGIAHSGNFVLWSAGFSSQLHCREPVSLFFLSSFISFCPTFLFVSRLAFVLLTKQNISFSRLLDELES